MDIASMDTEMKNMVGPPGFVGNKKAPPVK